MTSTLGGGVPRPASSRGVMNDRSMGEPSDRGLLRRTLAAGLAMAILPLGGGVASAATWKVARGPSQIAFRVTHLIFSEVEGSFRRFSGSVDLPGDDLEAATIDAEIEVASIQTGHRDRDDHLRSDEFLFAEAFPRIRFRSREVRRTGDDHYEIVGDLTIRGVTREIVLAATAMGRRETTAGPRLDFLATGTLNRYDYELRWNKIWDGNALLGEQVEIALKICLVTAG